MKPGSHHDPHTFRHVTRPTICNGFAGGKPSLQGAKYRSEYKSNGFMTERVPVLLAEDDEHDVFFMRRAFHKAEIRNPLLAVPNGGEAIRYLEGQDRYGDRAHCPFPGLLMLDLKMPLVDGFEVLRWVSEHPEIRQRLAVLVLSSSDQAGDRERAFKLGAHEYLVKPSGFSGLVDLVGDIKRRWLEPAAKGLSLKASSEPGRA